MDPERWQRIEQLYHASLEREPAARDAYLAEACAGDDQLRREVTALLAYDDWNSGFLSDPALQVAARALAAETRAADSSTPSASAALADTPGSGKRAPEALQPGQQIRHFRIARKLGEGGMGEVYLADDLKLGRRVALKLLSPSMSADAQARQRLVREARAASALNHPNIVTIFSVEEADGLDLIVMEYVEGETLREKIERGPLALADFLALATQAADALAAAHQLGIIHRDLKPGNIMVTPGGRVKVLDFGLAKRLQALPEALDAEAKRTGSLSEKGVILGTIPYMSPEQTRGEMLDTRSDLFSLGSVLYEAATGRRPFTGPSALAVLHEVATADPPPPSSVRSGLLKELDPVFQRVLAKDKEKRYRSAAEFAEALRGLSTASRRKLGRRLAVVGAVLLLLATAFGSWLAWHQAKVGWARENLPRVEQLMQDERYFEAYDLAAQIEKYLPDDATLARLMPFIADELSVTTDPPEAKVFLKRFQRDESGQHSPRQFVGTTPLQDLRIARGDYILAIEKDGYAPVQRTISSRLDRLENGLWKRGGLLEARLDESGGGMRIRLDASAPIRLQVKLIETEQTPDGMVFVPGGPGRPRFTEMDVRPGKEYELVGWGKPTRAKARLDDFFIDRYEVTNREYKEFITAGGYRDKRFWKHPIHKDGKELTWEEAVKQFTDRTGLPGPRGWTNQNFPDGKADHPVTDVTWYEAAAHAEFRGKQLPTIFQWEKAARDGANTHLWGTVLPWGYSGGGRDNIDDRANFKGQGTVPVNSLEFGMSPFGCYHMAGNAAEWCLNRRPLGFSTMGGSWKDPLYLFAHYGQYPGFYSAPWLGFRCARNGPDPVGDQGAMDIDDEEQMPKGKPVDEAQFRAMLRFYEYDKTPLDAKVVEVIETADWRREKITYRGGGPDRALGYLWLPKHAPRPLQLICYGPGATSYSGLTVSQEVEGSGRR